MFMIRPKWHSLSLWPIEYVCQYPRTFQYKVCSSQGLWRQFHGSAVLARAKSKPSGSRITRKIGRDIIDGRRRVVRLLDDVGPQANQLPSRAKLVESINKIFRNLEIELRETRPYDGLDMTPEAFWEIFHQFEDATQGAVSIATPGKPGKLSNLQHTDVRNILESSMMPDKLNRNIKIGLYNRVMNKIFSPAVLERQKELTDCRYPMEWYPRARLTKRELHLHVGPTNSGKTYQALKRLEIAERGCYAGPLRLLAQEIYGRMNARGKPTWLVTGDDQQVPSIPFEERENQGLTSCTVEMMAFNVEYDVAVIDEVQMAADSQRGHAWTAAIIGVAAKEVHLCGEPRAVPIIEEIARSLGEELIVHRYERLSPLAVADKRLQNMAHLEKGDCIVCFSVVRIHAMKQYIEKMTNKRCAIIYGGLPPEVRAQQARLFNEPDNDFDFLVASDAIGMGLNLAISRIVFDAVHKLTRQGTMALTTPEIRQIGGRAGRYRTSLQDGSSPATSVPASKSVPATSSSISKVGLVTAFEADDLRAIRKSMNTDPEPISKFGVFPTQDMIELFCTYFPTGIPYSFILARILEISRVSSRYFFCDMNEAIEIADIVQNVKNLSIAERVKICFAPVSLREPAAKALIKELANKVANQVGGELLSIKGIKFEILDKEIEHKRTYLAELETLHKALVLYLWMSFRFPGVFVQRPLAIRAKMLVEERIEQCLSGMQYGDIDAKRVRNLKFLQPDASLSEMLERNGQKGNSEEAVVDADDKDNEQEEEDDEEAVMQRMSDRDSGIPAREQSREMDILHDLQERHQSGDDIIENNGNQIPPSQPASEAIAQQ